MNAFSFAFAFFGLLSLLAGAYLVVRSSTTKATIDNQKDLINTLLISKDEMVDKVTALTRDMAEMQGQLNVLKDLPLREISENQKYIVEVLDTLTHHWGIVPPPRPAAAGLTKTKA